MQHLLSLGLLGLASLVSSAPARQHTTTTAAAAASTIPVLSVPVVQLITPNTTAAHIVLADRARHEGYHAHTRLGKRQKSVSAYNQIVSYVANVQIGSSTSNTYSLIVDTGSSNTWCGANKAYVKTRTSVNTRRSVSVSYGSGSFSGTEYTDTVVLGASVTAQSIGVATRSTGFTGVNGIIGFGPEDLTSYTVSGLNQVPTFMQNAVTQKKIPANILGVSFAPSTTSNAPNGVLTLGGPGTQYTGSISYQKVTTTSPASEYWGVTVPFQGNGAVLGTASGIVDTGTTLVYLPSDFATTYFAGTGFTQDPSSGLYYALLTSNPTPKSLSVVLGGTTFTWKAASTLVPTGEYAALGLNPLYAYSWVNNYGSASSSGLAFIIGQKFLEFFHSVFDTQNNQVGFATTSIS